VGRGPFNNTELEDIREQGIDTFQGKSGSGLNSPVEHLMLTLREFKKSSSLKGVIYTHDNAFLNLTKLSHGRPTFPSENIIGSKKFSPFAYMDVRLAVNGTDASVSAYFFQMHPNGTFYNLKGIPFESEGKLLGSLKPWP
jgi:hypothetical protein